MLWCFCSAIEETLEFSKAIQRAVELTSIEDTLIVVTSDHAHTMSISGYPMRGNDIFKLAGNSDMDKLPYTTLSYANGPGYRKNRIDLSKENLGNISERPLFELQRHLPSSPLNYNSARPLSFNHCVFYLLCVQHSGSECPYTISMPNNQFIENTYMDIIESMLYP